MLIYKKLSKNRNMTHFEQNPDKSETLSKEQEKYRKILRGIIEYSMFSRQAMQKGSNAQAHLLPRPVGALPVNTYMTPEKRADNIEKNTRLYNTLLTSPELTLEGVNFDTSLTSEMVVENGDRAEEITFTPAYDENGEKLFDMSMWLITEDGEEKEMRMILWYGNQLAEVLMERMANNER
jgi:hypothetical protein